jgi:transcriptional regulator with XRE-family HTH domain
MDRGRPANPLEYAPDDQPYQGSAIRQLRQAKKLGVRQFAALIPCNHAALSKVENNRAPVSRKTLRRIAEILGADAEELARRPVHPRLAQQQVGGLEQPLTIDQSQELEELRADVQELKDEVAEVKAQGAALRQIPEQLQALTVEISQLNSELVVLKHRIPNPYLALLAPARNVSEARDELEQLLGSRQN